MSALADTLPAAALSVRDLRELIAAVVRAELAERDQHAAAAAHPLSAAECARLYFPGPATATDEKRRAWWRQVRHFYPAIDAAAALGPPGRLRRWDAQRLAQVMADLQPKMRRRRRVAGDAA